VQYVGRVYANDRNSAYGPGYTVANAWIGIERTLGSATMTAYARVNNLADASVIGSVIVNDGNGRYFEPSPGRNAFVGVQARVAF